MRAVLLRNLWPSHELVYCEQLEKRRINRDLGVSRIAEDTLKKIMLFVVVGSEYDEVDDALQDLITISKSYLDKHMGTTYGL